MSVGPIAFTGFWLNDRLLNVRDSGSPLSENIIVANTIHLRHFQNSFSIGFAMLGIDFSQRNQYQYWLEGLNTTWQNLGMERKATFTNLTPDKYVFRVRARNGEGNWTEENKTLTVIIHPAWWQTIYFKIALVVVSMLMVFGVVRIRLRHLTRQRARLEKQVADRTQQLNRKNSELGERIEEIRLQNEVLHEQKLEIAEMNKEIQAQNEELVAQNDHISAQRERLEETRNKLREVNERLEMLVEQRTEKLQETVAELDKTVAELDRFVYSASHDLSAPLKSVLGLVQIAKIESDPKMLPRYFEYIEASIRKLDRVIKSLVEFSRNTHQEVRVSKFNLHNQVEEVLNDLAYWPEAQRITFENKVHKSQELATDQDRIKVILHNLVSNGIKYADLSKPRSYIRVEAEQSNSHIRIIVSDNGIGIDHEQQNKIFEMYYRASENSDGSGLGLFIVKEIMNKLDSNIGVSSEKGKGTAFTLNIKNKE